MGIFFSIFNFFLKSDKISKKQKQKQNSNTHYKLDISPLWWSFKAQINAVNAGELRQNVFINDALNEI